MFRPMVVALACLLSFELARAANIGNRSDKSATFSRQSLSPIGNCARKTVVSFYDRIAYPPMSTELMRKYCQGQAEGIKCIRGLAKNTTGIVRRGLSSFVTSRQRYHKRFCSNVDSDQTRKWIKDFKCIFEHRLKPFEELEWRVLYVGSELVRRNYNDSSEELKYICCTLLDFRRGVVNACDPECPDSKATVEDMVQQSMSNELGLVCDDDDRLATKVCPTLKPIKVPKNMANLTYEPITQTFIYLLATLGEADTSVA